jgi:Tfp pilus assembly protein PilV
LQLNALKYTDGSRMTSQASFIAYDMMDRIRANAAADYTVTPPTSGNLGVAIRIFTTSPPTSSISAAHRHGHDHPQSAGVHHHHQLE